MQHRIDFFYNERLLILWSLVVALFLSSCNNTKESTPTEEPFTIKTYHVSVPEKLEKVFYMNGDVVCETENGNIIVLDSFYRRQKGKEAALLKWEAHNLFQHSDTIWMTKYTKSGKPTWYYINNEYQIVHVDKPHFYNTLLLSPGDYLYDDSMYVIYGGCAGEFGGAIFFYNKITRKTYSYPATCPSQLLFHDSGYYLVTNLAHLGRNTSVLRFSHPDLLYETPKMTDYFVDNPWSGIDSISNQEYHPNDEILKKRKINILLKSIYTSTVVSFIHSGKLYSIQQSDSGYSVVAFNDTPQIVQRFNSPVELGYNIDAKFYKNVGISLLKEGWSILGTEWQENHNSSNLIIVKGSKIDILLCYNQVEMSTREISKRK